jgi:3-oxoacyl-[acyl-carrier-protein] synthase-3
VVIPAGGYFTQAGSAVQTFAIRKTASTARELLAGVDDAEGAWFVGHQANLLMLRSSAERAGVDLARHLHNVERFGNQGAAGAPSVLSQNWQRFGAGDLVAVVTVGSGLSWGGALIRFDAEVE